MSSPDPTRPNEFVRQDGDVGRSGYPLTRLALVVLVGVAVPTGLLFAILGGAPHALYRSGIAIWLAVRHGVHLP